MSDQSVETISDENQFLYISESFCSNIQSLTVFINQIGEYADQHDADVFDTVRKLMDELEELGISEKIKQTNEVDGNIKDELSESEIKILYKNISKGARLININSPNQGQLLRRGTLVLLISFYEILTSQLIEKYYLQYPDAFPSEERKLSLSELRMVGSIADAEKHLIDKEIDKVLRKSIKDQIKYIQEKLHINLDIVNNYFDRTVEISQRRNIIVHNASIINRIYLSTVEQYLIEELGAEDGETITISSEYLRSAIDQIFIVGLVTLQLCWRKWNKDQTERANIFINDEIFKALGNERYELVISLASTILKLDMDSEIITRLVVINKAIALKELGRIDEMEAIINLYDWSSIAIRFNLAIHILRDEEEEIYNIFPRVVAAKEINRDAVMSWPIFKHLIKEEKFINLTEELFPSES